jgi:hypothetical protein
LRQLLFGTACRSSWRRPAWSWTANKPFGAQSGEVAQLRLCHGHDHQCAGIENFLAIFLALLFLL